MPRTSPRPSTSFPAHDRRYRLLTLPIRGAMKLGSDLRITGLENIPATGPVLLVGNHLSMADPIVLALTAKRAGRMARFLALRKFFEGPSPRPEGQSLKATLAALPTRTLQRATRTVLRTGGHIPVDRDTPEAARALVPAEEALRRGECIGIYPEGRIADPPFELGRGHTGAIRLALAAGATVVPIGQWGTQELLGPDKKPALLKKGNRRPTIDVVVGEPLQFAAEATPTREQLAAGTERVMAALGQVREEASQRNRRPTK